MPTIWVCVLGRSGGRGELGRGNDRHKDFGQIHVLETWYICWHVWHFCPMAYFYLLCYCFLFPLKRETLKLYWRTLWVRQGLQWETPFSAPLYNQGIKSTLASWERSPQLWQRGIGGCDLPLEEACFTCVLSISERNVERHVGVCWAAWHTLRGGSFLHLSPLTWVSELGFILGSSSGFAEGPGRRPEVDTLRGSFGVAMFVCVHMCFCVLNMSALYPCQSIRQNTDISMENCIWSLKFSSWFAKPMWEFTDSWHLKFGQWS